MQSECNGISMVSTVTSYTDTRNRALAGEGYDGVVMVSVAGYYGTGVLLYDGQAILTAAHLFSHGSTAATVKFETSTGTQTMTTSKARVMNYDAANTNNDLAIVWLNGHAPVTANRYEWYRSSDEIGKAMTIAGHRGQRRVADLYQHADPPEGQQPVRCRCDDPQGCARLDHGLDTCGRYVTDRRLR